MKKILKLILIVLIIAITIMIFMFSIKNISHDTKKDDISKNVKENITINKMPLEIEYLGGKDIDDNLTYGNISIHEIKLTNNNKSKISFAIYLNDYEISNELVSYDIYYKIKSDASYEVISKDNSIKDDVLLYNITIDEEQELYIKLEFKSNKEGESTSINGTLKVDNNVSENELFIQGINKIQSNIEKKINSLNGISESGYYILDIKSIIDEDTNKFKGLIFIDALDISKPKYYYSVYNDSNMLNDYLYSNNIKKGSIESINKEVIANFNMDTICNNHTKKECKPFDSIKYNSKGDKSEFSSSVEKVINSIKEKHRYNDKRAYVYDIDNSYSLRGYILIDNTNSKNEYYLYLTNDLYMISGYNITKYGMFNNDSPTIRAYNETSFKLSAESKKKVCEFTGFTECFDANNKKI